MNWRAVHLETAKGIQITPNSVLAGQSFANLSRPADQHAVRIVSGFAVEDRPDRVCTCSPGWPRSCHSAIPT